MRKSVGNLIYLPKIAGGAVAQSIERSTPSEEVPDSIPAVAMVSQLCLMCGSTLNCQTHCLGARPQYNLEVDEDVKKPTKQNKNLKIAMIVLLHKYYNGFLP